MVNDLTGAIAVADQKIAEAESELSRFDEAFENLETEGTAADEHAWRAKLASEEAVDAHAQIKEKLNDEMASRHELQVYISALSCSLSFNPSLCVLSDDTGPTTRDQRTPRRSKITSAGNRAKDQQREGTSC